MIKISSLLNKVSLTLLGASVLLSSNFLTSSADAQVLTFGNNAYERIDLSSGLTWNEARLLAESSIFEGISGHLAVITSQAEDRFIIDNFDVFTDVVAPGFGPWIGAFCGVGLPCNQLSSYQWVTGEAFTYNGFGIFEPSGDGGIGGGFDGVQYLNFRNGWNDSFSSESRPISLIVEYEDGGLPTSIPELTPLLSLLMIGALGTSSILKGKNV